VLVVQSAQSRKLDSEFAFVAALQAAQVQTQGIVGDAADHRHRQPPQAGFEFVQHAGPPALRTHHQAGRRQPVHRQGAGTDLAGHGFDGHGHRPAGQGLLQGRQQALRLIADVGIVGVPNAGKSTLLSVISNARPKIADYPFTTLEPNLGVVVYDNHDLVVADIPGLVEGAHLGVGLGHAFLRHVQRTRLLVHLLNGASADSVADYNQINVELALYDEQLGQRPQIVVYNKMDIPEAAARWPAVKAALEKRGVQPIAISGATQDGIRPLVGLMFAKLAEIRTLPVAAAEAMPLYELPPEEVTFTIEQIGDGEYRVGGRRIERAAAMTYWDYEEAVLRFQRTLEFLGITAALREAGVQEGDTVYIGEHELEWSD